MGRAKKSEKSARSEDPEEKEPEPYQPTGNFQTDFVELCKELEMDRPPSVCPRVKRPSSPAQNEHAQAPVGKKGKEDKKQQQQLQQQQEPEEESPEEKAVMQLLGFKPKTFVVKNYLEMMRPCVQVELEHPDKQDSVTEIFIRDWRVESLMLQTLTRCFEKLQKLHTLNLWRIGANSSLISQLGESLKQLDTVKTLTLECNEHVPEENFGDLLLPECHLTKLQLRFNGITDKGAAHIAEQLADFTGQSTSRLVSLDLSSNSVGDEGAAALAKCLRTNRTLLHLSLSNNRIGDEGAAAVARVCSRFFLTHEEVVQRRKMLRRGGASPDRESRQSRPSSSLITPPPSRKGTDRPGSVRSQEKPDKSGRTKNAKAKKDDKSKADDKTKGKSQKDDAKSKGKGAAADKDAKGGMKSGKGRGNRVKMSTPQLEPEQPEVHIDRSHPLLEKEDSDLAPGGHLLLPGNYTLAFVNLARNQIGDAGVQEWKTALLYQKMYMETDKVNGTGILKLQLETNPFSTESEAWKILEDALNARNPLRPPPSNE